MKFDPYLSDEPSLAPATPGAALVRLSQLIGRLRHYEQANSVPIGFAVPELAAQLEQHRTRLLAALEQGDGKAEAFSAAQNGLRDVYAAALTADENGAFDEAELAMPEVLVYLGFRDPRMDAVGWVAPIDVNSIVVSHFKPVRQVFSTISFDEAHGATAYWLSEVRFFEDQRVEDEVMENYAPQFSRVRLPVGQHTFFIESRNSHGMVRSQEFTFDVPAL